MSTPGFDGLIGVVTTEGNPEGSKGFESVLVDRVVPRRCRPLIYTLRSGSGNRD